MKFLDEIRIKISSGKGGAGAVSFHRESLLPKGGPDGGNGGNGGSVVFVGQSQQNSLNHLAGRGFFQAQNGERGQSQLCQGKKGKDLILPLPLGTLIKTKNQKILKEIQKDKESYTLLKGGRGGKGNAFFKHSRRQAPDFAQAGEQGEGIELHLELKLLADVGIIGFPNAGKSTLLKAMSPSSKTKIAPYPFTTTEPQMGVVEVNPFYERFSLADIPGLLPDAHRGYGLGLKFLRHIERSRMLIHLLDASPSAHRSPQESYALLLKELWLYDKIPSPGKKALTQKKQILVLSKSDLIPSPQKRRLKEQFYKRWHISPLFISALTSEGIDELKTFTHAQLMKGP